MDEPNDNIKCCPFCGNNAQLIARPIFNEYFIMCTNLQCKAEIGIFVNNNKVGFTKEQVLYAWNKRILSS